MQSLYQKVETAAATAIFEAFNKQYDPIVRWSSKPGFGDLQINAAMSIAKDQGENPREVAQKILDKLDISDLMQTEPEIAGPGFINITFSNEALGNFGAELLVDSSCGISKTSDPQRIVIDYGGANIAKEMLIHHIRATIIGDALVRIFSYRGHEIIKQDHLGDWGTQFGMLVEFFTVDGAIPQDLPELKDLNGFYKQAKEKFSADEDFATRARKRVALLQGGDEDSLRAWRHIYNQSMNHLLEMYKRLGVLLSADDSRGESFYNDMLADVCSELEEKSIAVVDDGALCIYVDGIEDRDGNPFGLIIRKSDGGYGYATTDLAALKYNVEHDKADKVIYVVDARQSQHFQMVFDAASRAGWIDNTTPIHAAFGTMLGKDGKPFKTRAGESIKLADLLDEATRRAKNLIDERSKDIDENEKVDLSKALGIGAVKYADLSNNRATDFVFDFDRMLAMEGNTAPYLQYAVARINSILAKANDADLASDIVVIDAEHERNLIKQLSKFDEVIDTVEDKLEPHHICTYLFELAQAFSSFYQNCPVIKEENDQYRISRLNICKMTAKTLQIGLDLLGIQAPKRL